MRRLGEGAEVMVIETGVQPRVTAALGRDRDRALAAICAARARDLPHRMTEAVRTARALVGTDPRAEIHVFTDGALRAGHDAGDDRPAPSLGAAWAAGAATSASRTSSVRSVLRHLRVPGVRVAGELHAGDPDLRLHAVDRRQADRRQVRHARAERAALDRAAVHATTAAAPSRPASTSTTTSTPTTRRTPCCRRRGRSPSRW